jgi:hypothetical protein
VSVTAGRLRRPLRRALPRLRALRVKTRRDDSHLVPKA